MVFILLALILVAAAVAATVVIVNEYERVVVFRLGRLRGVRGPGPVLVVRGLDQFRRVTVQVSSLEVLARELITRDEHTLAVRAIVYFRVVDPVKAVVEVDNYRAAIAQIAKATVRAVMGEVTVDQLLRRQEEVNGRMTQLVAQRTAPWGVEVSVVEVKDIELAHESQPVSNPIVDPYV